jgi:hypothetical protein
MRMSASSSTMMIVRRALSVLVETVFNGLPSFVRCVNIMYREQQSGYRALFGALDLKHAV